MSNENSIFYSKNSLIEQLNLILCLIVGFLFLKLPWLLNLIITFSNFDFETTWYIVVPLILLPISIPFATYLLKKRPELLQIYLVFIIIGFFGMLLSEIGLYAYIQRFVSTIPTDITSGTSIPSIWLTNEDTPMNLIALWFYITLLIIVPLSIAVGFCFFNDNKQWMQTGHLSIGIIATVFAIREWIYLENGLYYIVLDILLIPFVLYIMISMLIHKSEFNNLQEKHIPVFNPTISILFFLAFWGIILEAQATGRMDESYLWGIPAIGSILLYLIEKNSKLNIWISQIRPKLVMGCWLLIGGATLCYVCGFLFTIMNEMTQVFLGIGTLMIILLPEYLISGSPIIKKFFRIPRQLIIGFAFIFGLIGAFIVNIEDPITSYVMIILTILFMTTGILEFRKKNNLNITSNS